VSARIALITGVAGGLGSAIARHLAAPGCTLFLHYRRDPARIAAVVADVTQRGAEAIPVEADLASAEDRERMMDEIEHRTRSLTLLVNNAGVYLEASLPDITPAQWQHVFDSTCSATFHITQRATPLLRAGAPARVVNIGDSGADRVIARVQATPYHVAKLGVHVLTRSFAKVLAPDRITVNQISPGFMENSVGEPGSPVPAGRLGKFTDILGAMDYLLSPVADYTTGANLIVSGGWNV
jgi:NAD(P)-dependent dehydrogenase (short-subunit alcohol dehydrogenase family)